MHPLPTPWLASPRAGCVSLEKANRFMELSLFFLPESANPNDP
jgi:hypothetical protein